MELATDHVKARLVAWRQSKAQGAGQAPQQPASRAAARTPGVLRGAEEMAAASAKAGAAARADKENAPGSRVRAGKAPPAGKAPLPARSGPPLPAPKPPARTPLPGKAPQGGARAAAGATGGLVRGASKGPVGASKGASGTKGPAASAARQPTAMAPRASSPAGKSSAASPSSRSVSAERASPALSAARGAARSAARSAESSAARSAARGPARSPAKSPAKSPTRSPARSAASAVPAQREAQDRAREPAYAAPITDTDLAWRWRLARAQVLTDPSRAAREAQVLAAFSAVEALRDQVAAQREALLRARARRMAADTAQAARAGALRDPEWLRVLLEDLAAALGRARELLPVDGAPAAPGQDLTAVLAAALATVPLAANAPRGPDLVAV